MGAYGRWIFPRLVDWTMRNADLTAYRQRLVPLACGYVLDVGIGSGLNLPFYGPMVERVIGLDPSAELLFRAEQMARQCKHPIHLVQGSAEAIPIDNGVIDSAVMTWTLCSVSDPLQTLREIRRVLKPEGELLFVEHGLAPDWRIEKWQHRLDPLWTRISCHLDRPVDRLLIRAGFEITALHAGYLPRGPRFLTYLYEGRARAS